MDACEVVIKDGFTRCTSVDVGVQLGSDKTYCKVEVSVRRFGSEIVSLDRAIIGDFHKIELAAIELQEEAMSVARKQWQTLMAASSAVCYAED